jgi:hypothetical protein
MAVTMGRTCDEHIREQGPKEIFGPQKEELSREWRKLHNEGLYDL